MKMHLKESIHQPAPPSAGGYALRKASETRSPLAAAIASPENKVSIQYYSSGFCMHMYTYVFFLLYY
jgi:hypothetical protein